MDGKKEGRQIETSQRKGVYKNNSPNRTQLKCDII